MPSESSFRKHAEAARDALTNFTTVRSLKAPIIVRTAVFDLIDAIIAFQPFIPFFITHELFQEISTSAFNILSGFAKENPSFVMPTTMDKVVAINDRVQASLTSKKGNFIHFLSF